MLRFFEKNFENDIKNALEKNKSYDEFKDWLRDELESLDIIMDEMDAYALELYNKYNLAEDRKSLIA